MPGGASADQEADDERQGLRERREDRSVAEAKADELAAT